MTGKIFVAACAALLTAGTLAAQENVYLIKGDRVVGKYAVGDVDYLSFELPEGIHENSVWLDIDRVEKNSVTYTVNTLTPGTTYAHGIFSFYIADYVALDNFGQNFDSLSAEDQQLIVETLLPQVGYLGVGTRSFTMTDGQPDGTGYGNFSVVPGTPYFVSAWPIDPVTQEPLGEAPVSERFSTLAPGESSARFDVKSLGQNEEGLTFSFDCGPEVMYVQTCYGLKSVMEQYVSTYGMDYLMGTFGQTYTPEDLAEIDGAYPTWPVYETAEYVMMARAYDGEGNMAERMVYAHGEESPAQGPEIRIFSKSKEEGSKYGNVSVNFEISPSNVTEAYVNMLGMSECDDLMNDGMTLADIARMPGATDITSDINTAGEYTFTDDRVDDKWHTILISAANPEGQVTTLRIDFSTLEGSEWWIEDPVYSSLTVSGSKRIRVPMRAGRKVAFKRL